MSSPPTHITHLHAIHTHTHTYTHTQHTHIHTPRTHIHTHTPRTHIHTPRTHIHTPHTHIHTHTHTHTHTWVHLPTTLKVTAVGTADVTDKSSHTMWRVWLVTMVSCERVQLPVPLGVGRFFPITSGPHTPVEAGTPSPTHGSVWARTMLFPGHSDLLASNLHLVMEACPDASQVQVTVRPGHRGVSLKPHQRSGDPVAELSTERWGPE